MYSETTDPGRHFFEVSFLFHLLGGSRNESFKPLLDENPGYMVTGFCLGMQSMNVATGGILIPGHTGTDIRELHTDNKCNH